MKERERRIDAGREKREAATAAMVQKKLILVGDVYAGGLRVVQVTPRQLTLDISAWREAVQRGDQEALQALPYLRVGKRIALAGTVLRVVAEGVGAAILRPCPGHRILTKPRYKRKQELREKRRRLLTDFG